jgi:excisionase family DNA binding protein
MPDHATVELPITHPLRLFTLPEAARITGISEATLHRWCQKDEVAHHNIRGTGRKFSYAELEQLIRSGERGPR